jgi:hypothetical protein
MKDKLRKSALLRWQKDTRKLAPKYCIICNKLLHKTTKSNLCGSCSRKRMLSDPKNFHLRNTLKDKCKRSLTGANNPNWRGGTSFEEYPLSWNIVKNEIKRRDEKCLYCGKKQTILHVHHIDYNKQNLKEDNLITLCNSCHSKTNFQRAFWKFHLTHLLSLLTM